MNPGPTCSYWIAGARICDGPTHRVFVCTDITGQYAVARCLLHVNRHPQSVPIIVLDTQTFEIFRVMEL